MGRQAPPDLLHPRTGEQKSFAELSREFGRNRQTIKARYRSGKRGWDLVADAEMSKERRSVISRQVIRRKNEEPPSLDECLEKFMSQPAGRLTTHLFRDYARTTRAGATT